MHAENIDFFPLSIVLDGVEVISDLVLLRERGVDTIIILDLELKDPHSSPGIIRVQIVCVDFKTERRFSLCMKALFFDKDGTLVDDSGFPKVIPTDNIYTERTVEGLRALQSEYSLFIVSNQGWISTGRMAIDEAEAVFKSVISRYAEYGVRIADYRFCPHGKADGCACRKPLCGMVESLAAQYGITKEGSWFIGDLETDVLAGKAFGIQTCVVKNGKEYAGKTQPDLVLADVNAFAKYVLKL